VSSLFGVIPAVAQRYVDTALARHRSETDLSKVTPTEFRRIQRSLNDRPRRTLGYMTPSEKLSEVVALTG
jgi:IS30 family transposase